MLGLSGKGIYLRSCWVGRHLHRSMRWNLRTVEPLLGLPLQHHNIGTLQSTSTDRVTNPIIHTYTYLPSSPLHSLPFKIHHSNHHRPTRASLATTSHPITISLALHPQSLLSSPHRLWPSHTNADVTSKPSHPVFSAADAARCDLNPASRFVWPS